MAKILNFLKLAGESLTRFFFKLGRFIKIVWESFKKGDKTLILCLIGIIIVLSGLLVWRKYYQSTKLIANYGGSYTEGMILDSQENIKSLNDELTKIGLVRFDKDGNIIGALAKNWDISSDQKTYTLKLVNFIKSQDLIDVIKKEKTNWQDQNIEIKAPDDNTLQFVLAQPFSPFLASLAQPIFEYGPYTIKNESKKEINYQARADFFLGKPYITDLNIKIYPNNDNLIQALKNREIDGVAELNNGTEIPGRYNQYEMKLPRYVMLFFNVNSPVFNDANIRKKLANNENLGKEINFDLLTSDSQKNLSYANEIKLKWDTFGAKTNIIVKDSIDLQKNIIPQRKYDALIYGLDYGDDPDPYPFWHSSQLTAEGLNLSNFSNVDADKLLEDARQTTNNDERNKKYAQFQKILDNEKPTIVLEQIIWKYVATKDIKGILAEHKSITPYDRFFEVWHWYIKEKRVKK